MKTIFYQQHIAADASMVNFYGWEMPLHYGSQIAEHNSVRSEVGIFDVSHMGLIDISGPDAAAFLGYVLAFDIAGLEVGQAKYGCMLNHRAGIIDDIICYFMSARQGAVTEPLEASYRLVVNAARCSDDLSWLEKQSVAYNVNFKIRDDLSLLAVQGPKSRGLISNYSKFSSLPISKLRPFQFVSLNDVVVSCTGYSGEDGFEIMLPNDQASCFWQDMLSSGAKPCGLGARDSLRLEAGLNLYGQDMTEDTSPWQVGLNWTVNFKDSARDFIGREAYIKSLQDSTLPRQVGLLSVSPGVLRAQQTVLFDGGMQGIISSASHSPQLGCSIALAMVPAVCYHSLNSGGVMFAQVLQKKRELTTRLVLPPFVRNGTITPHVNKYLSE